jgi:hypothetical protein
MESQSPLKKKKSVPSLKQSHLSRKQSRSKIDSDFTPTYRVATTSGILKQTNLGPKKRDIQRFREMKSPKNMRSERIRPATTQENYVTTSPVARESRDSQPKHSVKRAKEYKPKNYSKYVKPKLSERASQYMPETDDCCTPSVGVEGEVNSAKMHTT